MGVHRGVQAKPLILDNKKATDEVASNEVASQNSRLTVGNLRAMPTSIGCVSRKEPTISMGS